MTGVRAATGDAVARLFDSVADKQRPTARDQACMAMQVSSRSRQGPVVRTSSSGGTHRINDLPRDRTGPPRPAGLACDPIHRSISGKQRANEQIHWPATRACDTSSRSAQALCPHRPAPSGRTPHDGTDPAHRRAVPVKQPRDLVATRPSASDSGSAPSGGRSVESAPFASSATLLLPGPSAMSGIDLVRASSRADVRHAVEPGFKCLPVQSLSMRGDRRTHQVAFVGRGCSSSPYTPRASAPVRSRVSLATACRDP